MIQKALHKECWDVQTASKFIFSFNTLNYGKRNIWFYWGQGIANAPEVVKLAYQTWSELNPDFSITLLDDENIISIVGMSLHELTAMSSTTLGHAGKSDLLRLYLLYHFGGVWVDAPTFCLKPLSVWLKTSNDFPLQYFSQPEKCQDRRLVSWFLAAPAKSAFIKTWLYECVQYLYKRRSEKLSIGGIQQAEGASTQFIGRNITGYQYLDLCEKLKKTPYFWFFYLFNEVAKKREFSKLVERNEMLAQKYVQPNTEYEIFTSSFISKQTYRDNFSIYNKRVKYVEELIYSFKHPKGHSMPPIEQVKTKTLLCTGFHRSATSATANYLYDAGLDMGSNLMSGNISNVKGHFEDWDAVLLHDLQLGKSDTNWQFYDECLLSNEPDFLTNYIKHRNEKSTHWGVKDPRACLFLNEWKTVLDDSGYFLFVVRHWSSCIESLLHRHSRDLAYDLPHLNKDSIGGKFWIQPELAAKMWLSYNKRLLAFAKENPDLTLVITQRALFEGAPIIETLNRKFGFELDEGRESPFDTSLFRDKASQTVLSQLSTSLQTKLNAVWTELLELATFKSNDESPIIVIEQLGKETLTPIHRQISTLADEVLNIDSGPVRANDKSEALYLPWQTELSYITEPTAMLSYLDKTPVNNINGIEPDAWLAIIDSKFSLNGHVLLSVAKLLIKIKASELAISYFQKAVSIGVYYPYVDMMIAQCKQTLEQYKEAVFFFKKAISANPNNPVFYTNYAKLLVLLKCNVEAKQQFELGAEKGPNQPACFLPYCEFLAENDELNNAIDIAEAFVSENQHSGIVNLLTRLKLKQNVSMGQDYYIEMVTDKLKDKNLHAWLAKACLLIDSAAAEEDFITRCLGHWNEVHYGKR